MKRLLLLAAILAAVAGNLSGSPDQSSPTHKQEVSQQAPANPAPVTVTIENTQRSEPTQTPRPESPKGHTSPEGALVFVGIVTCLVIMWQSWETRKAAQAALLNAQALINAERPWIIVTAKGEGDNDVFMVHGELQGRTPAKIISGWGNHITVPEILGEKSNAVDNLPDEPPYKSEGTEIPYEMLAVPGQTQFSIYVFPVYTRIKPNFELWRKIENFEEALFLFGRLVYTDTLTKDPDGKPTEHETRWCFKYIPSKPEGMITKSGKPSYNRYT